MITDIPISPSLAVEPPSEEAADLRIGYVVKRYPRFSETFIVNEILAHEAAGASIEIFALGHGGDPYFQPGIADVRAPVTYLRREGVKADALWRALTECAARESRVAELLSAGCGADAVEVFQAIELAQWVQRRKIDHLHAHFATSAATVARLAALLSGIRYTFTAHAKDIFHEDVDLARLAEKIADAASVVTVSEFNREFLCQRFSEGTHAIRCIYNGLALEHYPFQSPEQRPRQIVAVGRLVEKKGFDVLLAACRLLADANVEFGCAIVGGGDQETALRNQRARLNLEGHVSFYGPLPQNEVFEIVQNSSLLAAPCVTAQTGDQDGMPTVLLEAMALGTPCVGTDVTGVPEAIEHGVSGWIVSQRSPEELAAAIHKLLDDASLRVRLAAASRSRAERLFNVRNSSAAMRSVFAAAAALQTRRKSHSEASTPN